MFCSEITTFVDMSNKKEINVLKKQQTIAKIEILKKIKKFVVIINID